MSAFDLQQLGRGLLKAAMVTLVIVAPSWSNESVAAETANYRRVFVPADRPEEWPTDSQQYLPVDRDEFQRLTKSADERRQLDELGGVQLYSQARRAVSAGGTGNA
jgi:hypothetical protein